jgi:hypothetical protein
VGLVGVAGVDELVGHEGAGRRIGLRRGKRGEAPEQLLQGGVVGHVVEVAGQERAAARAGPAPLAERDDPVPREAAQVLLGTQHRASQGVLAEGCTVDQVLGDRRRLVVGAVDLLDHDTALALELLAVEAGTRYEIGQQVDRGGRALGADGDVEGDKIVARIGVEHAPEALGGLVDLFVGRVLLAALEDEMLEEVRHPVLLRPLAAGAGVEGHKHRQSAGACDLERVQRQAVRLDFGGLDRGHCQPP